jgi:hypothetical protein
MLSQVGPDTPSVLSTRAPGQSGSIPIVVGAGVRHIVDVPGSRERSGPGHLDALGNRP